MNEASSFDLHLAECTAQAAAIWVVLDGLLWLQLNRRPGKLRTEFLDRLLERAGTITLPMSKTPEGSDAPEWIARRYWQLVDTFAARHRA